MSYKFGDMLSQLPEVKGLEPHPSGEVDEREFARLVRGCISLLRDEKIHLLRAYRTLSTEKVAALIEVFREEKENFGALPVSHAEHLEELERGAAHDWIDIVSYFANRRNGANVRP